MGAYKDLLEQTENDDLMDFVQELIDGEELTGTALGVAKAAVGNGVESLTPKQRYVFEHEVLKPHITQECEVCGTKISWSDMYFAEADGLCSTCREAEPGLG